MYKKFLLHYDADGLKALDAYCNDIGISRLRFIRALIDDWLARNKQKVIHTSEKIKIGMEHYSEQENPDGLNHNMQSTGVHTMR